MQTNADTVGWFVSWLLFDNLIVLVFSPDVNWWTVEMLAGEENGQEGNIKPLGKKRKAKRRVSKNVKILLSKQNSRQAQSSWKKCYHACQTLITHAKKSNYVQTNCPRRQWQKSFKENWKEVLGELFSKDEVVHGHLEIVVFGPNSPPCQRNISDRAHSTFWFYQMRVWWCAVAVLDFWCFNYIVDRLSGYHM